MDIAENFSKIRKSVPDCTRIVVAAKGRNAEEIAEAIDAGATDIGENYVQEAEIAINQLGERARKAKWHMIGKLQKNKIKKALTLFDVIQTVDSLQLACEIDKGAGEIGRIVDIYIEINIARERQKSGVMPEEAEELIKQISHLKNIKVEGIMTMGPAAEPESLRAYFKETKRIFEKLQAFKIPNVNMNVLSMGMSNSYKIAIEEGSNMIRIGTAIFGKGK